MYNVIAHKHSFCRVHCVCTISIQWNIFLYSQEINALMPQKREWGMQRSLLTLARLPDTGWNGVGLAVIFSICLRGRLSILPPMLSRSMPFGWSRMAGYYYNLIFIQLVKGCHVKKMHVVCILWFCIHVCCYILTEHSMNSECKGENTYVSDFLAQTQHVLILTWENFFYCNGKYSNIPPDYWDPNRKYISDVSWQTP